MRRLGRRQEMIALSICAGALAVAVALPVAMLAVETSSSDALVAAGSTLARPATWRLLLVSLGLASATTVGALLVGVPLGTLVARTDLRGRHFLLWLHAFPFFVPPYLLALGWFHLLGRASPLGSAASSEALFSAAGVVGVLTLAYAPVVTGLVVMALRGVDPALEEPARAVAPPGRVVLRILLPLSWPAIAWSALIVFAMALSETGVPLFLRVRTYPAAVFSRLGGFDYAPGEAFALALPLVCAALLLLVVERRLIGDRSFASLVGRHVPQRPYALGRWGGPAAIGSWAQVVLALAPIASLVAVASRGTPASTVGWMGMSLATSALVAVVSATGIAALGFVLGHALARRRTGAAALDALAMLAFVLPSAVLGAGIIAAWNRPEARLVYGSVAILVVGLVGRYAIVGARTVAASVSGTSTHIEEAAAVFGASWLRRMLRIVLPTNATGVATAWLLALLFCLRDLDTVILFYPPGREPLPVRIFTLEANGPDAVVAGLAVVQILATAVVLALGLLMVRRSR